MSGTETGIKEYQRYLLNELANRKKRNPLYSLRAFARDLDLGLGTLSEVLSGKRDLSPKNARKIGEKLSLSPSLTRQLLKEIQKRPDSKAADVEFHTLQTDTFRMLADWYFFAILNLARLKNNRANAAWVGRRLGISAIEARSAILLMTRLGFLKTHKGRLLRTSLPLFFNPTTMPGALKKFQHQILDKAKRSIDRDAVEDRYITTFILPIDRKKLARAKETILKFQKSLMQDLEEGTLSEVYGLSIQLFPLTQKDIT